MSDKPCCRTCANWQPEPWDMCPEQSDAFCIVEMRRTTPEWRCEAYEEIQMREFALPFAQGPEKGEELDAGMSHPAFGNIRLPFAQEPGGEGE